jgi:hypothetical protein
MVKAYGDLESYTLGKFTKAIDEIVYGLAGNGFCNWTGEAESVGCYTFVDVSFEQLPSDLQELAAEMDPEDMEFLRAQFGAITLEVSSGQVYVEYFETREAFEKAQAECEREVDEFYNRQEEEEEEEEEEEDDNTVTITGPRFLDPHDPRRPYSEDDEEEDE